MNKTHATSILLALGTILAAGRPVAGAPAAGERISWYFDAGTALRTAQRTGRPVVVLKIRADIGPDVKT